MSRCIPRTVAVLAFLLAAGTAVAEEAARFEDATRGIRLDYPAHWQRAASGADPELAVVVAGTADDAGLRCEVRIQDLGPLQRVAPELWGDRAIVRRQAKSAALELTEGKVERADVLVRGAHRYHEVVLSYATGGGRGLRVTRSTGRDRYILNATCTAETAEALPRLLVLLDGFAATFEPVRRR